MIRDTEFVGRLCNEACNLNLDVKDEITKVIRLGKNMQLELFKRLSNLREAEDKHKCLSIQHDLKNRKRGRKETPRGGQVKKE